MNIIVHDKYSGLPVLSLALVLVGCGTSTPPGTVSRSSDNAGAHIIQNSDPIWDDRSAWTVHTAPRLEIGATGGGGGVGGDEHYQFHQVVDAVLLDGGPIVVADNGSKQLRFFGPDQKYVRSVGGAGSGPGEFTRISWFDRYHHDSLIVFDERTQQFSVFGSDGEFARTNALRSEAGNLSVAYLQGTTRRGYLITVEMAPEFPIPLGIVRLNQRIVLYNPDGEREAYIGEFRGPEIFMMGGARGAAAPTLGPVPFARMTFYGAHGQRFYAGSNDTFEIRVYDLSGNVRQIVRKQHSPRHVSRHHVELYRASSGAQLRAGSLHSPLPETFPAYGGFDVDELGNLWVVEYPIPGEQGGTRFVFDPDGRYWGTVAIPDGLRILEIGDDYMLGIHQDEFDVEYIRVHRIDKPRPPHG